MTTVAFRDGVMACDSLMSGGFKAVIKAKVIVGDDCMVGFCGDPIAAYGGAQWIAGLSSERPTTFKDDNVEFLVYRDNQLFLADSEFRELPLTGNPYFAIGSGEQAAMVAMSMGATAKEAVKMAIKFDDGSGGRVREFSLE